MARSLTIDGHSVGICLVRNLWVTERLAGRIPNSASESFVPYGGKTFVFGFSVLAYVPLAVAAALRWQAQVAESDSLWSRPADHTIA